jgi:putative Mn2+ efflux pump MntP
MDLFMVLLVAVALAMDCFAVSLAAGTTIGEERVRAAITIALIFGLFQAGMAGVGWAAGTWLEFFITSFDHWVAFLILSVIGVHMIYEGMAGNPEEVRDYLSPTVLLLLAIATSMDSLGVGLSLALLSTPILVPAILIGLVSLLFSFSGVMIGSGIARRLGKPVEIAGGIILILIGIRILIGHFSGSIS